MNEIISAIEEHLKRRLKASQLDYYQVLGLEPFCKDKSQIESALQTAWESLRASSAPDASSSEAKSASVQIINKLLRQAQTILLDSTKKTAYDSQLAKLFEAQKKQKASGQAVTSATTPAIAGLARTSSKSAQASQGPVAAPNDTQLLPAGDPMQPYMAPFTNPPAGTLPPQLPPDLSVRNLSVDKRREELAELFPSLMMMSLQTEEPQEQIPAWLIAADRKPTHAAANSAAHSAANSAPSDSPASPPDLVGQLRKRRKRNNLLAVGTMILAALSLLGFATYRFVSNRVQVAKQDTKSPRNQGKLDEQASVGGDSQAGGKAPELVIAPNRGRKNKSSSEEPLPALPSVNRGDGEATPAGTAQANEPAMAQATKPDEGAKPAPEKMPEPMPEPEATAKPESEVPMKPQANPEPSAEPAATGESDAWKKSMTEARELLVQGDIKKFEEVFPSLLDKAVTKAGKAQSQRLDQAGQLYRIYVDSFEEAKKKARGTSTLKIGNNTEVSIVESTPEKLIIKAAGQNKTYEWGKLPFGIAVAISDLGLSESAPVDMAARAIYFSLHPFYQEDAKKGLVAKRIDGWFEKSVGKESIRPDLKEFVTDQYQ